MKTQSVHYTIIGLAVQPKEADVNGFLDYREGFENFPSHILNRAEKVIRDQVKQIERWRDSDLRDKSPRRPGEPFKAYQELEELGIDRCHECHCSTGQDWEYDDCSNKTITICPQCGQKYYLTSLWEDHASKSGEEAK